MKTRLLDWMLGTAASIGILLGAGSLAWHRKHEADSSDQDVRISKIEDTRFTREDAAVLRAQLVSEMRTPPKWVADRLDLILEATRENAADIDEIGRQVESINRRLP